MRADVLRRLKMLSKQLSENLMSAALCSKEIASIADSAIDDGDDDHRANGNAHARNSVNAPERPLLDEATLSIIWRGRTLHLGHTRGFWLLDRLARRPNLYVTHLDLLREVWDDELLDTTVLRSAVRRLRVILRQNGMRDLAAAITGHHGRYMLDMSRVPRHREVTAVTHRTSQS